MENTVLVIDAGDELIEAFDTEAAARGFRAVHARDGPAGLSEVRDNPPALIFVVEGLPEEEVGEVLATLNADHAELPVYLATTFRKGALEWLHKLRRKGLKFELAALPLTSRQVLAICEAVID